MSVSLCRTVGGLSLVALLFTVQLVRAQDPPADAAPAASIPQAGKSKKDQPTPQEILKAEKERLRRINVDIELRARFSNTTWNDVQLPAGSPGYTWWLRTRKNKGPESTWARKWHFSDQTQLPEVGTWDVKNGELLLFAADGRVVARGKMDKDEEVIGQCYNPDRKQSYGSFQLVEQYRRSYTIVPFRVIDPQAGK
jgi:hypothetical protein